MAFGFSSKPGSSASGVPARSTGQGVEPVVIHKVALAVWACGHGAASLTQADESGNSPLMEDVIQGLEALFRPR